MISIRIRFIGFPKFVFNILQQETPVNHPKYAAFGEICPYLDILPIID